MSEESVSGCSRALHAVLWVCQVIGALAFSQTGVAKIVGSEDMVQLFAAIGFGQWFRYVTGALEILGAVLLLIPGKAVAGASLLILVMSGATVAHLTLLRTSPALPLALLVLMGVVAVGRHRRKHHLAAHPH